MNFSLPEFLGKKEKSEYFLALLLRDEKISAEVFEEIGGKAQVVGKHEENFQTSIEEASIEEFLDVLDKAISTAEESLPKNIETQKTVFGVKETWVEQSKIKKEYLVKLRKACEALGLMPIGFLVVHEAIAHLLAKEDGAPTTAILAEVENQNLAVSIFKAGKLLETKRVRIEESAVLTCDKILHYFTCEILPSKIILFDGKNSEKLQQEFIGHTWSKSLSFLHVPQIITLPKGFDAKAILFGTATQMGFDILVEPDKKEVEIPHVATANGFPDNSDDLLISEFLREKDVAFLKNKPDETQEKEEEHKDDLDKKSIEEKEKIEEETHFEDDTQDEKKLVSLPSLKSISYILSFLKTVKFPKVLFLKNFKPANKIIFIPSALVIFIILILIFYLFGTKASVIINVTPKIISQEQAITFSTSSVSDFSKNIIGGQTLTISKDGETSDDVIGKKEVGEKAKGTITLYSRLSAEKTIPSGTVIKSSNGLEFNLDKAVTIASSSADASSPPTTATTSLTAKEIGKESNLPSGTKFTIGNFNLSDIVGKNDSAFSGGTKKEITAVSKEDQDKLLAKLPKDLENDAKNSLSEKVSQDKEILPLFIDSKVTKKEFNKKIGDEASKLTLKGTVTFTAFSYKKSELEEISKNLLGEKIKDGNLTLEKVEYEIKDVKVKNTDILAKINAKARLFPKIENEELIKKISGKSFDDAQKILTSISGVSEVNINLSPGIPFLPKILPRISKNVSVTINSSN